MDSRCLAALARHPDVVAVYAWRRDALEALVDPGEGLGWRRIVGALKDAMDASGCDDATLRMADAQALRFVREGDLAVCVVLAGASPVRKSLPMRIRGVLRDMRRDALDLVNRSECIRKSTGCDYNCQCSLCQKGIWRHDLHGKS